MALTTEWLGRVDMWRNELARHFYRKLGDVKLSGFATREQLTAREAMRRKFSPAPPGKAWGAKWEYGWFRGEVVLPVEAAGERIVLRLNTGGESLVFINDQAAGARDGGHHEITLARKARGGEKFRVLAESYAGHGVRARHPGPTPPGRLTVPEPPSRQTVVEESSFGVWNEDAYQLWMDVETLYHARNSLDADSLRVAEIDRGLRDFTTIVDFELPRAEMMKTVRACRVRLRPLLECVNGSTAPTMFAFGHGHLDVAFMWPMAETERKIARTLSNQLALAEEYGDYRFMQSQPALFQMLKERYPDLFERVRLAVRSGRIIADGAMWVESDANITGGESLIRQFIHGKRFFRDELGADCEVLWLPDVFGYSGALPQIMLGCGVKYFATMKIFWAYNGGDPFPYNTFMWEGIDGSAVLSHLYAIYSAPADPQSVIARWNERVQKDGFSTRLFPFGHGNGGGGPTRDHIEYQRRLRDFEGVPRCRPASPIEYFRDQEKRGLPQERYVGELYYQCHRGTYTSQAKTKKGNRKSELALREAEMWCVAAAAMSGYDIPASRLDAAWKTTLTNQFHDILPGTSVQRAHEEAEAGYADVIAEAGRIAAEAARKLRRRAGGMTVFNSLSWKRTVLAPLPKGFGGAATAAGEALDSQTIDGTTFVEVEAPPCGWTTLKLARAGEPTRKSPATLKATTRLLENELLKVKLNAKGEITSIFDKQARRELAAGACNSFRMYRDVTVRYDAWDIDSMYRLVPVKLKGLAKIELLDAGPLLARIRVTRTLNHSPMTQEISLRRDSRRVDFATNIDWRESHKLLKVAFDVDIHADEAIHEIQFGHVRRPTHSSRPFDADRFEVCNQKWSALAEENRGFAVLNDCKFGLNVLGGSINLTLLKSPLAPDMNTDKGLQEFTYAFCPWTGSFADCDVVRQGYDLNCPAMTAAGSGGEASLLTVDAPNVIVETVKPAEDLSGDVVVRMYEAKRSATRCAMTTLLPIARADETDMLEKARKRLRAVNGEIALDFRPFEIKTVRLRLAKVKQVGTANC